MRLDLRRFALHSAVSTAVVALGTACGFEMKTLLTCQATRAAVLSALDEAAGLHSGDTFLLTYSGHGGQVPDRNGDEDDYADETWCLYDGEAIDDEIYYRLSKLAAGVRVLVLSDSCHSGTVTRGLYDALVATGALRAVMPEHARQGAEIVFRAMPEDIAIRTYQRHRDFYDGLQASVPAATLQQIRASVRLISGCQDNQLSADGTFNGMFTAALLGVWKTGRFEGTYRDFHRAIVDRMPPTQTPNHFVIGIPDPVFDAQNPFSL